MKKSELKQLIHEVITEFDYSVDTTSNTPDFNNPRVVKEELKKSSEKLIAKSGGTIDSEDLKYLITLAYTLGAMNIKK